MTMIMTATYFVPAVYTTQVPSLFQTLSLKWDYVPHPVTLCEGHWDNVYKVPTTPVSNRW